MLNDCYTFKEIQEKYGWDCKCGEIAKQITYAKNRGVNIEYAFKQGKSYFKILDNIDNIDDWKEYPNNPKYEVSKQGLVRNKDNKQLVGARNADGYLGVTDTTQTPAKYYRIHRMVMETFNPMDNSDMYIVDHINGKRNDNRLENLRWITQRHNMEEKDKNYAKLNENYQKLIQRYGYDGLNQLFESILNTLC